MGANLNKKCIIKNCKYGNNTFFITWEKVTGDMKAVLYQYISPRGGAVLKFNFNAEIPGNIQVE